MGKSRVMDRFRARLAQGTRETEFEGFPLRLRFVPMALWLERGQFPQMLAGMYLSGIAGDADGVAAEAERIVRSLTNEDAVEFLRFKRRVIEYAAVEPRIVFEERELTDDEVSAEELATISPGILDYVYLYAMRQTAEAQIPLADGKEVSGETLANFRPDGEGEERSPGFIVHGAEFQRSSV